MKAKFQEDKLDHLTMKKALKRPKVTQRKYQKMLKWTKNLLLVLYYLRN